MTSSKSPWLVLACVLFCAIFKSSSPSTFVATTRSSIRAQRVPAFGPVLPQRRVSARGHRSNSRAEGEVESSASAENKPGWMPTLSERKKVIPLGLMFFCILFNYTILRNTKDVLVVTAPKSGAEIIPFLKTNVQLPGAVIFTVLYAKMSNSMSQEKVFYTIVATFLGFFVLFGYFMYPINMVIHPHDLVDSLAVILPASLSGPLAIIRNWSFALFYMMAELWGSAVVSVLFWGLANRIMSVTEAKRYYPLFGLGANLALIFSGSYMKFVSDIASRLPPGVETFEITLKFLMLAILVSGSVIMACMWYVEQKVLGDPSCVDPASLKKAKTKTSMTLVESAKYLASSSHIRNIAMLVVGYGMAINIVEVTWKARLQMQYTDPNAYSLFMGHFSQATGAVTLGMMLLSRFVFAKFGWGFAAKVTPIMLLLTGIVFFSQVLLPNAWMPVALALGTTPLMLSVLVGAAQNILSKSSKYSLFDPCKEMAYIPLDAEQKSKGKAAIDVIGNPLGKSGGSFIQQLLILTLGSLAVSAPYLGGVLVFVVSLWIGAAASLAKKMSKLEDAS